jgi:hypothetical protein
MIKYPSISQFRQIVKEITERACFIGLDEEGKAQFDYLKLKPVLTFSITPKAHGTNAGVCYSEPDGIWYQSRENVITTEKDNMGFVWFIEQNKENFISIIKELAKENGVDLNTHIISVYMEWIGKGIQKNVAISELEKCAVIFEHFKVSPIEPQEDNECEKAKWYKTISYSDFGAPEPDIKWSQSPENKIFNIMNFQTSSNRTISIDFNNPEKAQNELIKIMEEVEAECPIGKSFGVSGTGEGVVISYLTEDGSLIQAKVKGEAHAKGSGKVKTLNPVDIEKLDKIDKCVEEICHDWRFVQALREVFGVDYEKTIDRKRIGEVIKWVNSDTLKEESSIISDYGFEPKDVMGKVQQKTKEYFFAVEQI